MIIPIVLSAAYMAFGGMSSNYSKIEAASEATSEAQRGLDTLVREIRQAQEIKDGGGAFEKATGSECFFYCDVDRDGVPERISYYVNASDLYRAVGKATTRVYPFTFIDGPAERVMNLGAMTSSVVFTYYSNSDPNTPMTSGNLSTIAAVGIDLSATRPSQGGLVSVKFSTRVKVRALFNSLS